MLVESPLNAGHALLGSPMRILTVANVPPDPNSGAAGTVYHTNVALRALGHKVDEIWADQLGPRRIAHGNLHSLIEQPRAYSREVMRAISATPYDVIMMSQPQAYLAAKALRKNRFSGIVVNRSHGLELRVDETLPSWHRKLGVPESTFPRSLLTPVLRKLLQRQWNEIMKSVDGVIVPCEMDRALLMKRYSPSELFIRTVHHGVTDSLLQKCMQPMTPTRQRMVLHVGQYAFFKGPHLVAAIMNRVFRERDDVQLTWVTSEVGCAKARSLINPEYLSRVRMIPWTTQDQLAEIYDQHGIFLFPSLCEGAAKSAIEAMARGLCVVASDDSGPRDYIQSQVNGWLCPVGDIGAFTDTVLRAIDNADATAMSSGAVRYAHKKTWSVCALELQKFFYQIIARKSSDDHFAAGSLTA